MPFAAFVRRIVALVQRTATRDAFRASRNAIFGASVLRICFGNHGAVIFDEKTGFEFFFKKHIQSP